ncbi:hypothetical protein AtNW77_Chr1g0078731 [Arabidopsis thaliana]|uniref:Uncharacterized protein n=2 Tax=Arabidopsis TaxID=3701 RepID=A0A5S9WV13_ARATH|nr:hypothetical protein ISN45_At01g067620 [Arabidopsis thaliana x Arabidopsis arenosa]CAA0338580.1 unnamed protein product [Arabidopsis thaliana]VYS51255.1 unnamed protein product [Arabidopsis thaliana]
MEGQREEKIERDTVLISAVKEDKEEVSSHSVLFVKRLSPASVQVPVSSTEAELVVSTGRYLVKNIVSISIAEKTTKTKRETLICIPRSETILENSVECWKEIHSNKDDDVKEERMEITKVGCASVGHCLNLTPEKLMDEYTQLELEEAVGTKVKRLFRINEDSESRIRKRKATRNG